MGDVSERDGLSMKIRSTVQFEFGSLCDHIDTLTRDSILAPHQAESLKRSVRLRGNNIIRIVDNHLEHVNVSRNFAAEEINTDRVKRKINERLKPNGDC